MKKILLLILIGTLFSCGSLIYPLPSPRLILTSAQLYDNHSKIIFLARCQDTSHYGGDTGIIYSRIYSFDIKKSILKNLIKDKTKFVTSRIISLSNKEDRILFESNDTKSLVDIIDLEGNKILQFEGTNPIWSPNSNKIIYSLYYRDNNYSDLSKKLFVINSDGSNQQELNIKENYYNWINNNEIIFSDNENNMFTFNIENKSQKDLQLFGMYPEFSSDGNKIAFIYDQVPHNLTITNTLGEDGFKISQDEFPSFSFLDTNTFRWSNNKIIISAYNKKNINNIYLINTDEKILTKLTSNKAEHKEFYNGILFDNESKLFYIDSNDWGRIRFKTLDLKSKELEDLLTDEIYRTIEKDCK